MTRTVTGNYIQDTQYNTLTSYCMLTFIYTFKTFGGKDRNPGEPQGRGNRHMGIPMEPSHGGMRMF